MQSNMERWNGELVEANGFSPCKENPFGSLGRCWSLSPSLGEGLYWVYGEGDLFDIKIHDFCFYEDTVISCNIPGYLSALYYDSACGEQLSPHIEIGSGSLHCVVGKAEPYKIFVHKNVPVRSIGIGITPAYYEKYMKESCPDEPVSPYDAFVKLERCAAVPELVGLLKQVESYHGGGLAGRLFYRGKVDEAVSLLISHTSKSSDGREVREQDLSRLQTAVLYINSHYSEDIRLEHLARLSYMSVSKLKETFKEVCGCSVTSYIQTLRLSHAERLLSGSDLPVGQIAQCVGYSTSSRLSALLRKKTGLTPGEYRRLNRR